MKERLGRILTILCVLTLVCGCLALGAAEGTGEKPSASYAVSMTWSDEQDADGVRPASVTATLQVEGKPAQSAVLNAANSWTAVIAVADVPAGAAYSWQVSGLPAGYIATQQKDGILTVVRAVYNAQRVSVQASQQWVDRDNAQGVRPSSVTVRLLADGVPYTTGALNAGNSWTKTWKDLPKFRKGTQEPVVYTVEQAEQPAFYTAAAITGSQAGGFVLSNTLETGALTITEQFHGLPLDVRIGAVNITVSGPDSRAPITIAYSQFSGGRYTIQNLLPGAYLVQVTGADSAVSGYGYTLVTSESVLNATVQVLPDTTVTAALHNNYRSDEEAINIVPRDTVVSSAELNELVFRIEGPDPSLPKTVKYSQFTNGRYELDNLVPGEYIIYEENAGTLIDRYELSANSITAAAITVSADGTAATVHLINRYVQLTPKPAVTPTPSQPPEADNPEETPAPPEEEKIDIPVIKHWVDNNNQDGNRPASVTVRLLADGSEVGSVALSAANSWQHTFVGLPKYVPSDDPEAPKVEIAYTITEDPVQWYDSQVSGFSVTNVYHPEVVSMTVTKIWDDYNNAIGMRPASIHVHLSNGSSVVLSQSNGWTATIDNLPKYVNGQPAVYTWYEQEVLGYTQTGYSVNGSSTIITNSIRHQPPGEKPEDAPKKTRGENYYVLEDYETPLGVEVTINHVGDCFD